MGRGMVRDREGAGESEGDGVESREKEGESERDCISIVFLITYLFSNRQERGRCGSRTHRACKSNWRKPMSHTR